METGVYRFRESAAVPISRIEVKDCQVEKLQPTRDTLKGYAFQRGRKCRSEKESRNARGRVAETMNNGAGAGKAGREERKGNR
jgi:hypothetical protein